MTKIEFNIFRGFFYIFASFYSIIAFSQSTDDLDYLKLLPDSQAQSIAEKLGVQTGKPINDEVVMDGFDDPRFESLLEKESNFDETNPNVDESVVLKESKTLDLFGLDFFKDSPSTFAPIDLAPAPKDYILGPGDFVRIQMYGNLTINREVPVSREGSVVIPEIGTFQVSGISFNEFREKLKNSVSASLIGTEVEISLSKIRSVQVFVLGNAENPGAYTVSSLSNISNVLFFSGGPTEYGSLRNISLKRNGYEIGSFDFYELLINGNTISDLKISSNDAIVINPIGKTVSISGEIKRPSKYELSEENSFEDLLRFSSGFSNQANLEQITISSIAKNGERVYENLSYPELSDKTLKDGDEIFVHKLSNTPRNIIKIIGSTTAAGILAYEENLFLEDIIEIDTFLETTYTPFAIIERENLYGSKSLIRTNLLTNDGPKTELKPNDIIYVLSKDDVAFLNSILVADALGLLSKENQQSLSRYFYLSEIERYRCKSLQMLARQSSSSSIKFVKSKYFPNPNLNPIDQLEFVKSCPKIFEDSPYLAIFSLENASVISGEIRNPGIYPSFRVSSINDLLSYAGGMTQKASGKIDFFTDEGRAIKIDNIDKNDLLTLGINASFYANLSSKFNEEVFSVSLEGSFNSPGVYGAKQGERLSDVIKRAGGYKRNAYPYGGILARKSVAEKEKLAFLKSADQLEESIATAISSGRISSVGGDPSLVLSSISGLITNLENIDPIGRVVTEFDLDTLEKFPEKDLMLEPGDRIFVPERSSTVTVSGQVLSPTSFSFDPSKKVKDYISLAGGYSEDADKARTLIIYPNGRASRMRNWPNAPDLSPGMTLVVPRDPNPFDWLVFSQVLFPIISNFATSAAAIAALGNNN
jgi:polysaccharide export outer membrane protein